MQYIFNSSRVKTLNHTMKYNNLDTAVVCAKQLHQQAICNDNCFARITQFDDNDTEPRLKFNATLFRDAIRVPNPQTSQPGRLRIWFASQAATTTTSDPQIQQDTLHLCRTTMSQTSYISDSHALVFENLAPVIHRIQNHEYER